MSELEKFREDLKQKSFELENKLKQNLNFSDRFTTSMQLGQTKSLLDSVIKRINEQNNPRMDQEVQINITASVNSEFSKEDIDTSLRGVLNNENFSIQKLEIKEEAEIYSDEQPDRPIIGIGTKVKDLEDNSISMVIEGNPENGSSTILLVELEGEYANQVITDPARVENVNNISDEEFNSLVETLGQDLDDYEILT